MDAQEAVAAAQVVIEKAERTPFGQRHEPDREFGKFHRKRIQVHPIQAALGYETPGDHGSRFDVARQWLLGVCHVKNLTIHAYCLARGLD